MEKGLKSGINFDEYGALTAIVLRDYNAASSAIVDFHLFSDGQYRVSDTQVTVTARILLVWSCEENIFCNVNNSRRLIHYVKNSKQKVTFFSENRK